MALTPDERRARNLAAQKRWREANKEKIRADFKAWYAENKENHIWKVRFRKKYYYGKICAKHPELRGKRNKNDYTCARYSECRPPPSGRLSSKAKLGASNARRRKALLRQGLLDTP
jgi:hypothetical protein